MDIETLHFEDKGLTVHVREDRDSTFYFVITNFESSDAVYESYGFTTLQSAVDNSRDVVDCPLPLTF